MIAATAHTPVLAEETRTRQAELTLRPVEQVAASKKSEATPAATHKKSESTLAVNQSSRSRLAYDKELARVFVEIVDLDSGEVVDRFPPEELVRHMKSLIEQEHLLGGQDGTGLLVDRLV
jgi:uncharacterized FlaG/YvyC family protein